MMVLIDVACPIDGCGFNTGEVPDNVAVALLTTHTTIHASPPTDSTVLSANSGPKLERPKLIVAFPWKIGMSSFADGAYSEKAVDSLEEMLLFSCFNVPVILWGMLY